MARNRQKDKSLYMTRIYKRHKKYLYLSPEPYLNPFTGKKQNWHTLCDISEGELKARQVQQKIIQHNIVDLSKGNMAEKLDAFLSFTLEERSENKPDDPEKLKMFLARNKTIGTIINVIKKAFIEFDVALVEPSDIAQFLDSHQKKKRMTQVYRSTLSDFFKYAVRKGWVPENPVRDISVKSSKPREVYVTDEQFNLVVEKLDVMVTCFIDLCYLTCQRSTEIRLLKWEQIKDGRIYFNPSKTANSSDADVIIPITPEIQTVIEKLQSFKIESEYVICSRKGEPYTTSGIRSAWNRACQKVGVSGVTIKDLRAKALTDAVKAGYDITQVQISAAHSDPKMTEIYIKEKETPTSDVVLKLPRKAV